jgi:hypothetical protein
MEKESLYIFKLDAQGSKIKFPNADTPAKLGEYTYSAQRMAGTPTLTATLNYPSCLDDFWSGEEFVEFRGEKYYVDQIPTSSKDNKSVMYKHELQFVSERIVLENVYFMDVVTAGADTYHSNSTSVKFMGDINEFVGRLNASMTKSSIGYSVVIDDDITSDSKLVSLENVYLADALQSIYTIYELPYYFVGKVCHIGYTENVISTPFEYRKGLVSIKKTNANYKIVNRVTGVGSSDNIPFYYPNDDETGTIERSQNLMPSIYRQTSGAERFYNALNNTYKIPGTNDYYSFKNTYSAKKVKEIKVDFSDIKPTIEGVTNASGQLFGEIADIAFDANDSDELGTGTGNNVFNGTDEYVHSYFYIKLHIYNGDYGFNLFEQGLEGGTAVINMTTGNCAACEFEIGVTYKDNEPGRAFNPVLVDSAGNLPAGDFEQKVTSQTSQYVESQQNTSTNEVWIAVKKDNTSFGVVMPNATNNYKPSIGDKFVITGIKMPKSLVLAAEKRLDEALIKYMSENNDEKFTFSVNFSRVFLADNIYLWDMLNENARIYIKYNNREYLMYVNSFTCKADKNCLYDISVELTDKLSANVSALRSTITEIAGDIIGNIQGGGYGGDILAKTSKHYIRKDQPDSAKYLVKFLKGIHTGLYTPEESGGMIDEEGNAELKKMSLRSGLDSNGPVTTDEVVSKNFTSGLLGVGHRLWNGVLEVSELIVRKTMHVFEIIVQKVSSVNGSMLTTPGGGVRISEVEELEDGYKCLFNNDDGTIPNPFVVGDQALHQVFTGKNIGRYWRLVTEVGDNYFVLSKTDCEAGSGIPQVEDEIIQFGNRTDKKRQNAVLTTSYGSDAPYTAYYSNVNSYSLEGKEDVREGNLRGINDPDFGQLQGSGFYGKNVYMKGVFRLMSGKTVEESIGDVQSNLDNLQVGETNLLDNSNKGWKNTGYPIATIYLGDYKPKQGEECTIVIKGKLGANKTSWGVYNSGGNVVLASFYPGGPDTDYIALKTFKWTLTPAIDNTFIRIYPMPNSVSVESEIEWVKLVLGNKTSLLWTPSINDQRQIAIDEAGKAVDGIQVGGVNILIGSTTGTGWTGYTEHKDTEFSIKDASTIESYIRSAMIRIPGNKEIVVSFYAKHTGHQNYFDFYILPASYPEIDALLTSSYQSGTDWTYNEFKFTTPSGWGEGTLVYLRIDHNGMSDGSEFIISVKDVQIEYGNKATTYSVPESDRKEIAKQQGLEGGQEAVNGLQIGSQNLISKKMMLKWNEKNKDIAVWGQDEDGIYLAVNQKLLYNSIAEGTERKDIFNSAIQFKQNTQNVLSFEYKSGRKIIPPVISFRICYTDGSYENVNLSGSDTTKTRTDYITDSGKTVDRISLNNSISDENVLIYNISLIEGNKPLQGFPVAEEDQTGANNVNLADGTKEFTVTGGTGNWVRKELYVSKIKPNTVYYVNAGNIQNLAGTPSKYTFVLYDKDITAALCPMLNADKNGGFLITYNNFTEQEGLLLCYAGVSGSTAGNSVKFTEVMLVEGFLPAPVWTPSFSEQQAEIKTITETLTEIRAENGEISLKVSEVSTRVETAKQEAINTAAADATSKANAAKDEAKNYTDSVTDSMWKGWIDASKLDESKYYPVVMQIKRGRRARIELNVALDSGTKPSWSTHDLGFTVRCIWESSADEWGTTSINRIIEDYHYRYSNVIPAGDINQMTHSSNEYIYVRGGGKYYFAATNLTSEPSLKTSAFTVSNQTIDVRTSVTAPTITNATKEELNAEINITKGLIENKVSLDVYNENDQLIKSDISNLQVSYNQISSTVSKIINGTQEISGVVTQSNFVTIFSSNKNALGQEVIESINVGGGGVTIDASRINLNGAISANGNVQITTDGKLIAVNGEFTGKITATSGIIGGFEIGSTYIQNNGLKLSSGSIEYKGGNVQAHFGALYTGITGYEIGLYIKNIMPSTGIQRACAYFEGSIGDMEIASSRAMIDISSVPSTKEALRIRSGQVYMDANSGGIFFKNVQNVNGKSNYYLCIDRSTGQLYYR